jgi:hypothetical protein
MARNNPHACRVPVLDYHFPMEIKTIHGHREKFFHHVQLPNPTKITHIQLQRSKRALQKSGKMDHDHNIS